MKIENYRPLTMLETDYKILTKVLSQKLGVVAPDLIHENQAGFVPGRSLYDHIKLAQLMPDYAESDFKDGLIVSLDQEKAYDKIDHDYLWQMVVKCNFPQKFTQLVKTLYSNAKTSVMVNGVIPTVINIKRGTREGDPMSCILYNLAIEPLACTLRESKELKGYKINGKKEITRLFSDDTLVYLNKNDKIKDMEDIIEVFCKA